MKLFVAGLPNDFDETDLREMFELYGDIRSAKLITDRETGKSKGFGFIEMPNAVEAQETIEALNGAAIKGKKLSVQPAEDRPPGGGGRSDNRGGGSSYGRGRNDDNRFNRR
jgi:cold-inducible RNA-binding protein